MAEISRKDTMPLDDMDIKTTHVDDILAGVEEEQIGVMGDIPLPGAIPTRSQTQIKVSNTSAVSLSSEQHDEEPEFKVKIPDLSNLVVGENIEVALDDNIPEPEFNDIEEMSVMDDEPPIVEEPHMTENEDNTEDVASINSNTDNVNPNSSTDNSQSSQEKQTHQTTDYSNIEEASGPTFVFGDEDDDTKQESINQSKDESVEETLDSEDDDTIDSVVYEEGDDEFDGEQIKNAYKSQKPHLTTKAQQIIGFLVVVILFLLIFGISKFFDILNERNASRTTEPYQYEQPQPESDANVWFLEKNNTEVQTDYNTQVHQPEPFTFAPNITEVPTTEQSTVSPTEQATPQQTEESPSVGEIFGLADSRFETLDDLTNYLNTAITTISAKTNDLVLQYENGEISRNEYQSTLNTYYQAIVELAQLLVANKQVYTDEGQVDIYETLETQIRDLATIVENAISGIQ